MAVQKLPYKNLAGTTTCPGGSLVAAEEAFVVKRLTDVLDDRPTFGTATMLWTARRQPGCAISRFALIPPGTTKACPPNSSAHAQDATSLRSALQGICGEQRREVSGMQVCTKNVGNGASASLRYSSVP
jgi:hypothetical protein